MPPGLNLIKTAVALIMLAFVLVPGVPGIAGAQETAPGTTVPEPPPELDARAWVLVDTDSGLYLTGKEPDERLPIASMTKIMAALVALEEDADLDEEVMISEEAESFVGSTFSNAGLIAGEQLSVWELLVASLVPSGTEAMYTLAEYLGGGSVDEFVEMMNAKANSMGLENTHFENPIGLDEPGNYSSARDLAQIAQVAMEYPSFAEIVSTVDTTISTQSRVIEVSNTNDLLSIYPAATGVKTGTSPEAGPSLVASARDGDEAYIAVVLDAGNPDGDFGDRFATAQALLDYAFIRFESEALVREGQTYEEPHLPYRRGESVELVAAQEVDVPVDSTSEVERRVTSGELPPEAEAGQRLGEVEVFVGGQSAGSSPLVAREGYEAASLWQKIWYPVQGLFVE